MIWIMTFMFIKIIPEFKKMFAEFHSQLPALTNVVVGLSDWFVCYWYLFSPLTMVLVVFAIVFMVLQTNVVICRPIGFRRMFRSTDTAKFLRLFSVGVRHRFPIPTILEMYRWTVPSEYLRQKGWKVQNAIEKGRDWIDAVRREGFVNGPEASLLQSAQRTGNTAAVLEQLAQSKERSQIRKDDLFSKLVFIPLVFLLGAVIGTFVIAMFLPLIKLITDLSG
jgi:type IV pilus assembly protein PilC